MSVLASTPPARSVTQLREALRTFSSFHETNKAWTGLHHSVFRVSQKSSAYPLYSLQLTELIAEKAFGKAIRHAAWLYFLSGQGNRHAIAEVSKQKGKHGGARISEGKTVETMLRVMDFVKKDHRSKGQTFHLRFLRSDSLHLLCLWLKGSSLEYFVPINQILPDLNARRFYSREQLHARLLSEAQRLLESHKKVLQLK
jgi:hypothetical protein